MLLLGPTIDGRNPELVLVRGHILHHFLVFSIVHGGRVRLLTGADDIFP